MTADLHFGVDFSVIFEGVEGLQDGVVIVGTCTSKSEKLS